MSYTPTVWLPHSTKVTAAAMNNIEEGIVDAQSAGIPNGGTTGQILRKVSGTDYDTAWNTLAADDVAFDLTATYPDGSVGKISQDLLADAKATSDAVRDIYPVATVGPSAVVSVDDAAPLDAEGLVAQIEPVQDLHGYDNPWPAGGGKNKTYRIDSVLPITTSGITVSADGTDGVKVTGTASATIGFNVFEFPVESGKTYTVSFGMTTVSGVYINLPKYSNGTNVGNVGGISVNSPSFTFTADGTFDHVRGRVTVDGGINANGIVIIIQAEEGSTATSYSPYSNICPISGRTGVTVQRTGVNQWDEEYVFTGIRPANGQVDGYTDRICSKNFIAAKPLTSYYLHSEQVMYIICYDKMQNFIGLATTPNSQGYLKNGVFTTLSNTEYIKFSATNNNYGTTYNHDISINYPATDTAYHAYQGTTLPVTFPSEAGTVYGGYVDLVNGKLVVDRVTKTVTTCRSVSTASTGILYAVINGFDEAKAEAVSNKNISDAYTYRVNAPSTSGWFRITSNAAYIFDDRFTDFETANVILASEQPQIVYELATPITYDIDPVTLTLLRGDNNVWANTGDTTLTYRIKVMGVTHGGTTGQMLVKKTDADYDTEWVDQPDEGVAPGGTTGQMLVKATDADYDTEWVDPPEDYVTQEEFDALRDYVREMSPVAEVGGTIVSVDDAAPLDAEGLVAQIEPVQDLHGYDHPWPGGSGINKIDMSTLGHVGPTTDYGDTSIQPGRLFSELFPVQPSTNYYVSVVGQSSQSETILLNRIIVYDGNQQFISRLSLDKNGANIVNKSSAFVAIPDTAYYAQVDLRTGTLTTDLNASDVTELTFAVGNSEVPYSPYSNICPISGWTGANVSRTGANIWDEEWETGTISLTTGQNSDSNNTIRSLGYIGVRPDTSYYFCCGRSGFAILQYDADKNYIGYVSAQNVAKTIPSNCHFIRFRMYDPDYGGTYMNDISINYPSTDHDYHPYTGSTFPVTFPASAGTVYGGYVDLVEGKLIVDRAMYLADGSVAVQNVSYHTSSGLYYIVVTSQIESKETNPLPISNRFKSQSGVAIGNCYVTNNGYTIVAVLPDQSITTKEGATQWFADNPTQFVYELATPITYDIDPVTLTLLRGDNNVWANTGDVTLSYGQDVAMLLSRINEHTRTTRSMIAGIETTMTATRPYSTGELLIVGDTLYRVATPIANGAAFTPGTNVSATTVAEQLLLLANT